MVQPGNIWINTLQFTIKRSLRIIILMIPSFSVLIYLHRRTAGKYPKEYVMLTLLVLTSFIITNAVSGFVRNFHIDGFQIATNYYTTAGWVFIYVSFLTAVSIAIQKISNYQIRRLVVLFSSILSLLYVFHFFRTPNYMFSFKETSEKEKEAYTRLKTEFEGNNGLNFGYFRNYGLEENHNTQKSRSYMFFPMERIALIKSDGRYFAHCLSVLDYPDDILPIWDDHKNTKLYQYKNRHPEESNESCVVNFINEASIEYIIVEDGASLPTYLQTITELISSYDGNECYKVISLH